MASKESTPAPHVPKPTVTLSQKTLKIFVGIFLLLLAIVIGGILYLTSKQDEPKSSSTPSASNQSNKDSSEKTEDDNKPALKTGIKTDRPGFEVQIDSIESSTNSITVNFSIICDQGKSNETSTDCYSGDLWFAKSSLAGTYVIDDAAQQKYEVIKDANDNPVVSDTSRTQWLSYGEKASFFVNLTKPPKGSTVTIYIPSVQPVPGITIKN